MNSDYSKPLLVGGFTKLFSTIVHSTVWRTDMHVKVVWVTMLAMADRNGQVLASVPGLADAARVSLEQCVEALTVLSSPDEWSRTKANEGRRIAEIDGGWVLLNYLKYRELRDADERRIQTRFAVAKHRAIKAQDVSKDATVSHGKPRKAQAEAEAEADQDPEKIKSVSSATSAEPSVLTFPTIGLGAQSWDLPKSLLLEWQDAYPGTDVMAECRKALAWIKANKPKTQSGMKRFLVNWLNRAANSSRGGVVRVNPEPREPSEHWTLECERIHQGRCSNRTFHEATMEHGPR